jgi:hypothetical protein
MTLSKKIIKGPAYVLKCVYKMAVIYYNNFNMFLLASEEVVAVGVGKSPAPRLQLVSKLSYLLHYQLWSGKNKLECLHLLRFPHSSLLFVGMHI